MVAGIDGQAAAGRELRVHGAQRAFAFRALQLAEEYVGGVLRHDVLAPLGIGLQPLLEGTHRHLVGGEQAFLDQIAANRAVGVAVLAVVVDADDAAVRQLDAARSLHLQEEQLDRIGQIDELEIAALQRPLLDLGAGGVGLGALVGLARVAEPRAGSSALRLVDEVHEIGGALVDRGLEYTLRGTRALQQRLVVAREQAAGTVMGHGVGREMPLEERLRLGLADRAGELACRRASGDESSGWRRNLVGRRALARGCNDAAARLEKRLEGRCVVILIPAGHLRKCQRLVGDGALHVGAGMRLARRARLHETRGTDAERRRSEKGSSTTKCTARHQNAVPRCKLLVCPIPPAG